MLKHILQDMNKSIPCCEFHLEDLPMPATTAPAATQNPPVLHTAKYSVTVSLHVYATF